MNPTGKGGWKKGQSGNPKGRGKSESRKLFEKAIKQVEKEKKKKYFKHVIECSWTEPSLMKEVLKKLVPDLKMTDVTSGGETIADIFARMMGSKNGDKN
jgi:hypothetical protein